MPLPVDPRAPWPPKDLKPVLADMAEADAWYSSDVERLRGYYGAADDRNPWPTQDRNSPLGRVKFWTRRSADRSPSRQQLHIPLAADIASTSADLLFSEPPKLIVPGAAEANQAAAKATQERLDQLAEEGGLVNTWLEAGEVSAALGGVYLRAVWDSPDRLPQPTISVVQADAAAPEWRWGRLHAVTFWTVLLDESGKVWRHLERHEPGVILHGLYVGDRDKLGKREPLEAHPTTAALLDGDDRELSDDGTELAISLPDPLRNQITVRYVPNVRPSRRQRGTPFGRSDYDGSFGMMDALDEVWTSWMRDLRLGQARVIVSQDALGVHGRGKGASFDPDQEVFAPLDIDPTEGGRTLIEQVQFRIRTEEHAKTALDLVERIVSTAGYSPQSFGLQIEGRAESGSALRIREGKSLKTQGRKQRYWLPAIPDLAEMLLVLDREIYGRTGVEPARPAVKWGDSLVDDPREMAETVDLLARARAASVRTRVQMVSPHLEGDELQAEVDQIMAEEGMGPVADPAGFGA